jgi:hypothetical protein
MRRQLTIRVIVMVVVMPEVVILHLVSAAEAVAKVGPLVARPIRMTEIIVPAWIGVPMSIDIVPSGLDTVVKTAVPGRRPLARRLHRLPLAGRWPLLRADHQSCAARKSETGNQSDR